MRYSVDDNQNLYRKSSNLPRGSLPPVHCTAVLANSSQHESNTGSVRFATQPHTISIPAKPKKSGA